MKKSPKPQQEMMKENIIDLLIKNLQLSKKLMEENQKA